MNEYEQKVRSIAESLSVFYGRDGALAGEVHSMALHQQVPIDRLLAWMCYLKSEIARGHFMANIGIGIHDGGRDPVPDVPWEPNDSVQ